MPIGRGPSPAGVPVPVPTDVPHNCRALQKVSGAQLTPGDGGGGSPSPLRSVAGSARRSACARQSERK